MGLAGENQSPRLFWENPQNTECFAVTVPIYYFVAAAAFPFYREMNFNFSYFLKS